MRRRVLLIAGALLASAGVAAAAEPSLPPLPDYTVPDGVRPDGQPDASSRHDVSRAATPVDLAPLGAPALGPAADRPGWVVRDPAASNTDPAFAQEDRVDDGEPVIAVNPKNQKQIALLTGRDGWEAWNKGGCTPDPSYCSQGAGNDRGSIWLSDDGGRTWAKRYDIPRPTGVDNPVCTCDRVFTWTPEGELISAFLVTTDAVRVAKTDNPFDASRWRWPVGPDGKAVAVGTHDPLPTGSIGPVGANAYIDQPWIVTAPDPADHSKRNVFVSYADDGTRGYDMRYGIWVATSHGTNDMDFSDRTQLSKVVLCCDGDPQYVQPFLGLASVMTVRLAANERSGTAWALYGLSKGFVAAGPNPHGQAFDTTVRPAARVEQRIVRTVDGGRTWTFGGSPQGIAVDTAFSVEESAKFGDFSALYGGTHTIAADPRDDGLYAVYGDLDLVTKKNRLSIRKVTVDAAGNPVVGDKHFVTGQVDAAIPAVAVADDGTVGVLYYTHDGYDANDFAVVTVHLARSRDGGATFDDTKLVTFSAVEKENPDDVRQRPLGDYQQLLAVGDTFHGVSVTNGAAFGRPVADWDPLFVSAPTVDGDGPPPDVPEGQPWLIGLLAGLMLVTVLVRRGLRGSRGRA